MRTLSFVVPGRPVPQGGMKAFARGNRAFVTHSKPKELGDYRARVAIAAQNAGARIIDGPVSLTVTFVMPRPKSHYGTGRNAGVIKPSAPYYVTTKPDVDKLLRSLFDALTSVAIRDDSQVVMVTMSKVYADQEMFTSPSTEVAIAYLASREEQEVG